MERMNKSVKKATQFLVHKVMLWPHTYPLATGGNSQPTKARTAPKSDLAQQ